MKDLIAKAQRAASGGNLQSWYVYALANDELKKFKRIVAERIADEDPRHIKSEYPIYPEPMFGAYKKRREEHGVQLYGSLGIGRDDAAGHLAQYKRNFEFFNAPVALFITIDRRLGPGQWADLGGYIHTLAFLARAHGLDTCPQEAWARLYDTVGEFVKMPPERDAVLRRGDRLRRPEAQGQRFPLAARRTVASSASFTGLISPPTSDSNFKQPATRKTCAIARGLEAPRRLPCISFLHRSEGGGAPGGVP